MLGPCFRGDEREFCARRRLPRASGGCALLRGLCRFFELRGAFGCERFPRLRHVFKLLPVLRVSLGARRAKSRAQLGRDGRNTLRAGTRHWQP
jgi:hypothetical protein